MALNRDAILGAQDLTVEEVAVPQWGGTVRVRVLTGAQREAFNKGLTGEDGKIDTTGFRAKLLAHCVVGDDDQPLFTVSDIDALNAKSDAALQVVFDVADRLNKITPEQVEAEEKNSSRGPTEDSSAAGQ